MLVGSARGSSSDNGVEVVAPSVICTAVQSPGSRFFPSFVEVALVVFSGLVGLTVRPSRIGLSDVAALDVVLVGAVGGVAGGVVAGGDAGVDEVPTGALLVAVVLAGAVVLADDDGCVGGGVAVDAVVVGATLVDGVDDGAERVLDGAFVRVRVGALVRDDEADRLFDLDFDADVDVDVEPDVAGDAEVENEVDADVDVETDTAAGAGAGLLSVMSSAVTAAMSAWIRCPWSSDTDWVDWAVARSRLRTFSADKAAA